jgi:hypothetical protein
MLSRRFLSLAAALALTAACGPSFQQQADAIVQRNTESLGPEPGPPSGPIAIDASAGRVWDAVVAMAAMQSITAATIDRSSGLYQTKPVDFESVGLIVAKDCPGSTFGASYGKLTILVRGDSTRSTVELSALFVGRGSGLCTSTGRWERAAWREIKARAEGQPVPSGLWRTEH